MKTAIVLFAGVMTASAAFAGINHEMAEERYRAKYGRNTPAEEARKRSNITDTTKNLMQDCCWAMHGAAASSSPVLSNGSAHEAHFRAKYGRSTPREEMRQKAETKEIALHMKKCAAVGQCPRVHGLTAQTSTGLATPAPNDVELRLRAKYGRSAAIQARQAVNEQPRQVAVVDLNHCEHGCCNHIE